MPLWLTVLSIVSLSLGVLCAVIIVVDIAQGNRQHMWIMEVVWPVTALYAGPVALYAYYKIGRLSTRRTMHQAKEAGGKPPAKKKSFRQGVALGATHCGSGCALGDVIAEWLIFALPFTVFGKKIFAAWLLDYGFAFALGIAFQYFTIAPMRGLSFGQGLLAALKADSLSLTAWQIGMYGWMAIATFAVFGRELEATDPVFRFMMQIAMWFGFLTSYPVNWWLLRKGIKEAM